MRLSHNDESDWFKQLKATKLTKLIAASVVQRLGFLPSDQKVMGSNSG